MQECMILLKLLFKIVYKTHLDKETFYGSVKFFCISKTMIFTIFPKNFKYAKQCINKTKQ